MFQEAYIYIPGDGLNRTLNVCSFKDCYELITFSSFLSGIKLYVFNLDIFTIYIFVIAIYQQLCNNNTLIVVWIPYFWYYWKSFLSHWSQMTLWYTSCFDVTCLCVNSLVRVNYLNGCYRWCDVTTLTLWMVLIILSALCLCG